MMQMLFTKDLSKVTICDGLKLNDLMTFPDKVKVNEFEEMICSMDTDTLLQEIMSNSLDPYSSKINKQVSETLLSMEISKLIHSVSEFSLVET